MARRDVDLVIRAKDESSKAVDAITQALNELAAGISNTEKKVDASDSAFAKLGKSITTLDKAMRGMSSTERLGSQLDRATASSARLEQAVQESAEQVQRLAKEMAEAGQQTSQYNTRLTKTTELLEKEKTALKATQAAVSATNKELIEARSSRSQLETAEKKLTSALAAQEERLAKQQARFAQLTEELNAADTPTKRLTGSLNAAGTAIQKTTDQLASTRAALDGTKTALVSAAQAETQYVAAVEAGRTGLETQKAVVDDLKAARAAQTAEARQATAAERQLGQAYQQAASSLASQQTGFEKSNAALAELKTNVERAETAVADLARAAQGPLTEAYRTQQSVVSKINNTFQQNRQDLAALSALMGQVGVPTQAMAEAMERLNRVNRETATEYQAQQAVLRTLRTELTQTSATTSELSAKQHLFATAITEGTAALGQVTAEVNKAGAASQRIITANEQAARSYRVVVSGTKDAANAAGNLEVANDKASESYRRQANASRQAMSYVQRLRGEVLSLISSYGGLYAIISLLDNTVTAYQKLEAAQSRLNAITGGNQAKTAEELDFLRRNADRLGIQFGALADEYTKFAASTKNTVLEGQRTRDVFLAIAEAGTVNRLSLDDMGGILKAVTQIASKGRVQLEELSGQLGDRLPGALQIMADGLGVSVEQLLKMTKAGDVASDSLVHFAEELNRRYGPALGAALAGTTVYLGQLSNAANQAMLTFAKSGFIDGFNKLLRSLIETMQSADFQTFAANAGAAFGKLAEALALLARNFGLVVAAITAFTGAAVIPAVLRFGQGLLVTVGILKQVETGAKGAAASIEAAGVASAATAGRVAGLATAFRLLTSSTGIGLVITAVATGLAYWSTMADKATIAMTEHGRIVDQVKNAYDKAGQSAGNWAEKIEKVTKLDATNNLLKQKAALDSVRQSYVTAFPDIDTRRFSKSNAEIYEQLRGLDSQFRSNGLSVDDYKKKLSDLNDQTNDRALKAFITTLNDGAEATRGQEDRLREAEKVLKLFGATAEETKTIMDELRGGVSSSGSAFDEAADNAKKYQDALDDIKKLVPELKAELEQLKGIETIVNSINSIKDMRLFTPSDLAATLAAGDSIQRKYDEARLKALKDTYEHDYSSGRGTPQGAQMEALVSATTQLAEKLGVSGKDLLTAMSYETGGTLDPWKAGPTTQYGQHRGLIQWGEPQRMKYGVTADSSVEDQIKAVGKYLEDAGVKAGDGLLQIYAAINGGNAKNVNASDAANGGAPGTVTDKVNNQMGEHEARAEALLKTYSSTVDKAKELAKADKATTDQLTTQKENIAQQELINAGKEREAYILKAVAEAEKNNKQIGADRLAQIKEQAGKEYDVLNAKKLALKPAEDAKKSEEDVNNLIAQRQGLQEQMRAAQQSGDYSAAEALKTQIAGVNTQLEAAIDNSIKMWEAVGGTEGAAAIEQLKAAKIEAENFDKSAQSNLINWTKVGEMLVSGLTNAFDQFAEAVASGTDVTEALRDAFLKFASDFLIQIGRMIVEAALFNLIRGLGGPFATLGLGVGRGHTGGLVGSKRIGSGNGVSTVNPAVFASAPRFHSGTAAPLGLRPGEVPAVLKEGEEVLAKGDPRNVLNGGAAANGSTGGGSSGPSKLTINNFFDAADVVSKGLNSGPGEESVMNIIKSNRGTIRDIMDHG